MTDAVAHRGPDASGTWSDAAAGIALGHRRLTVLDLSEHGRQPMASASGRFQMVYNGEVYNFASLREELRARGASFRGTSDTEVLLAGFEDWGIEATVPRLHGMFAFAVWDAATQTLTLARDRLGEKPLYGGWCGSTLLFGSELPALRAFPGWDGAVNPESLALYLRHGWIPAPYAIDVGAFKLLPGTLQHARLQNGRIVLEERRYWSARDVAHAGLADPLPANDQVLLDEADAVLRRVVKRELVSDVPLGAFLSGGVDSSLIVALMQAQSERPVRTFTIGFEDAGLDEAPWARKVAQHLGTDHVETYMTHREVLDTVPRVASIYDEPFGDPSEIPTALLATVARRDVTVSLSGDGGDELFGGYGRYQRAAAVWRRLRVVPPSLRQPLGDAVRHGTAWWTRNGRGPAMAHRMSRISSLLASGSETAFYHSFISQFRRPGDFLPGATEPATVFSADAADQPNGSLLNRMMYLDLVSYLPDDILVKVDRATMHVGLESRAPFLDHDVISFAWRVPAGAKQRHGEGKWLLRELLRRYVPAPLVDRPKMGFAPPTGAWMRGPLREWMNDLLAPDRIRRAGLLDAGAVDRLRTAALRGVPFWDSQLWTLLMFESWRDARRSPVAVPA
jgi:asparagine synthase (glutamine-hydrolysing)